MTVVGDGEQRRDYTHVFDVAEANLRAAFTDNEKALGEVINIGTGTNHSVLDLINLIGGDYKHIPERPGEAKETLADITKLKEKKFCRDYLFVNRTTTKRHGTVKRRIKWFR